VGCLLLVELVQAPPATAAAPGLAISVPASSTLGTVAASGSTLSAVLGDVTVTTSSAIISDATWTATVSASAFTTGGRTAAETIPAANVSYLAGAATVKTGLAANACVPGQVAAVPIGTAQTAYSCSGLALLSSTRLTWRPTVTITLPASVVAGTYSGTITHSVA
jgi:hypothetical protein